MAECYLKGTERVIIPAVREAYIQPFEAPNWLDLRVGFFLSITDDTNDDLITGLAETITQPASGGLLPNDRYWLGLKTNEPAWPRSTNVNFIGYSNSMHGALNDSGGEELGNSVLSSSDAGIGAGSNYWWPNNSSNSAWAVIITDSRGVRTAGPGPGISQQHFAQVVGGAGAPGYATLFVLRLRRHHPGDRTLTVQFKGAAFSGDTLFSSTPTKDIIETNLTNFPTTGVTTRGPVFLHRMPSALYFYWPFRNSRLRIHSIGVMKYL